MLKNNRHRQRALATAAVLAAGALAVATPARAQDCVIKVARIVPKTGPLAAVGQMTPWVDDNKMAYVKSIGGLKVGDKTCTIAYKIYDSKSTVAGSSEAATRAILDDKADVVMPQGTPDTTNAPSDLCERYGVPCIAANTPVEAWLFGPDGKPKVYKDSYEFFFSVPDLVKSHLALIKALPDGFNGKIGVLYPSDADGVVFASLFGPAFKAQGWTEVDPGRFEEGLPDFSAIVNQFKRGRVEVVAGVLAPPDLQNYLQQAAQAGFKPRMYVIDKGTGYPGAMQAIGAPGMNVLGVNFWSPAFPGKSAYGGWTGQDFANRYEAENKPLYYTPTGGYEDASYDVLFAALQRAGSTDRAALIKAIGEIDVDTIVGHVKFNAQHYSVQPLGEAEWRVDEKTGRLVKDNVFNAVYPDVKITAPLRLYQK
jgi:branched-chain amino acid transport system substrate-binding protein